MKTAKSPAERSAAAKTLSASSPAIRKTRKPAGSPSGTIN